MRYRLHKVFGYEIYIYNLVWLNNICLYIRDCFSNKMYALGIVCKYKARG